MPFDSKKRSTEARVRQRDQNGHFIPIKPKVKVTGQANLLSELIDTSGNPDSDSMMGVYFKNPFKKIIEILDDIRKKQSTKVNLSFTIPLVALPIVIIMAFQFGRYQSSCNDYFSSQIGTLQNITITRTFSPDNWFLKLLSSLPYLDNIYNRSETLVQPILVKEDGQTVIIQNEANTDLDPFTASKITIFGNYNSCSAIITLDSAQNISNY